MLPLSGQLGQGSYLEADGVVVHLIFHIVPGVVFEGRCPYP